VFNRIFAELAAHGGLNSELHAVCDGDGRPLVVVLSEGQTTGLQGAALMLDACRPSRRWLARSTTNRPAFDQSKNLNKTS
jgi:hypothetical protein